MKFLLRYGTLYRPSVFSRNLCICILMKLYLGKGGKKTNPRLSESNLQKNSVAVFCRTSTRCSRAPQALRQKVWRTYTRTQSFERPFRCLYCLTESCMPREIFPDLIPLSAFAVSWLFLATEVASPCTQIVALNNCSEPQCITTANALHSTTVASKVPQPTLQSQSGNLTVQ